MITLLNLLKSLIKRSAPSETLTVPIQSNWTLPKSSDFPIITSPMDKNYDRELEQLREQFEEQFRGYQRGYQTIGEIREAMELQPIGVNGEGTVLQPQAFSGASGFSGYTGFSGYNGVLLDGSAPEWPISASINSPQDIKLLSKPRIQELLIKALEDEKIPVAVLTDFSRNYGAEVGFDLSNELKELLFTYIDPNFKPPKKRTSRMIRRD